MGSKSNYLENGFLNHVFATTTLPQPAGLYVSLHTADPDEDASGSEVSGGSYARLQVLVADWTITNNTVTNDNDLVYAESTAAWGTVSHFGIWDASSGGNLLYYGAFSGSISVPQYSVVTIPSGDITVIED